MLILYNSILIYMHFAHIIYTIYILNVYRSHLWSSKMDIQELRDSLSNPIEQFSALSQCEVYLLDDNGIILVTRDKSLYGSTLFFQPPHMCSNRILQFDNRNTYSIAPFYYCVPIHINNIPEYYLALSSFDNTRLPRDCALIASGIQNLLTQLQQTEFLKEDTTSNDKQTNLINALLSDSHPAVINSIFKSLALDDSLYRAVICIELSFLPTSYFSKTGETSYEALVENQRSSILSFIRGHRFFNHQDLSAIYKKNEIVIIKSFIPTNKVVKINRTLEVICKRLKEDLSKFGPFEINMARGDIVTDFMNISSSYRQAKDFISLGKTRLVHGGYYNASFLLIDLIYASLHPQALTSSVLPVLEALKNDNGEINYDLLESAESVVDAGMSYAIASEKTGLHRNTLHSRVERFCNLTGLEPLNCFRDALIVKLAAVHIHHNMQGGLPEFLRSKGIRNALSEV